MKNINHPSSKGTFLVSTPRPNTINRWIKAKAVSSDGRYVAISGKDNVIRVWDSATGQPIGQPMTGSEKWVARAVVSPDGRRVAAGDGRHTTRLWDTQTGRQIGSPLGGHDVPVAALAFSPDGQRLATAGDQSTVRFWDANTGAALSETAPAGDPRMDGSEAIWSLAFSTDGHFIAAGGATVGWAHY